MNQQFMRELVLEYYRKGLYTLENMQLFLHVGYITQEDYDQLVKEAEEKKKESK